MSQSPPKIATTIKQMQALRSQLSTKKVGFVPTMGSLHQGHISLLEQAKRNCTATVLSIFVNDKQFAPHEDFNSYPRVFQKDLDLLEKTVTPTIVFAPTSDDMYPPGFCTTMEVQGLGRGILDGISRPHFFAGVATVVNKLLNIVQPQEAFFGQKDAQQCVVIKRLVEDLNIPTKIIICPTLRESNGLAMSSRNQYLTDDERHRAGLLYRSLKEAEHMYINLNIIDAKMIQKRMIEMIQTEPTFRLDYVKVVHPSTLQPLDEEGKFIGADGCLIALACWVGKARLIDNIVLKKQ